MNERHDDLQEIIDAALREMAAEEGDGFDPQACNLAEFCRRTGLTRSRARTVRAHGFRALPHGNSGRRAAPGVLAGHTGLVDDLLRKGVTNSQVIFERLLGQGYAGGLTTVKTYIAAHRDLVPAKRRQAAPQGCRGQRFRTAPGEAYQMDWGFVAVERPGGERARIACFAMVCHHCGSAHVEFFPNARQENLLIGMLHAFSALGVPATVLTDNMKSVVVRRDVDGRPVWQADYAEFMGVVGFRTRLCRPRHPYTKGKVERLVRFVKGNFLAGRSFTDLDALNREAALWCAEQGGRWRRAAACVPMREHEAACSANTRPLEVTAEVERYLCPRRKISFDGFVSFEGHRYGVPYWYVRHECRVNREGARGAHIQRRPLPRARRPRRRHRRRQLVRGAVGDIAGAARGATDPAGGDRGRADRPAPGETRFREVRLREGRMMAGAGASPYELASDAASRLGIAVGAEELAALASDLDLGDGEMAAVAATFSYLAEKRRLASIETLLRLSRLPRREPKTFEGFDFSRIQGRDAAALGKLPSLADLYAHRNVAFVGPGGIGKTHLAQAYGRECCMRGLKTYYIKATELRDRFQKAVQRGNTSRVVSSLVKQSCLIVDEVGRCVYDRPCTDLFFDVVDRRYEKEGANAMVLTSNIAPSGWDEFFTGDDTLLCALDRLFDKASVFVMRGPSYRGRGLDTYSVEAVPQAVKVRGIQPEGM